MNSAPPAKFSASDRPVRPRRKRKTKFLSVSALLFFVCGILAAGIFSVAMSWSNTEEFCLNCHEMKDTVYREYQSTVHYTNRSGVRAVCSDCHVPREFIPKMFREMQALGEIWHSLMGTISTPEKFAERRPLLAQKEWQRMKASNSQACRNCHDAKSFDFSRQGYRSVQQHQEGLIGKGQTCIDCHKGIAHQLPNIAQGINESDPQGIALDIFKPAAHEKPVENAKE